MLLTWLGHSCFLLQSEAGTTLMMDPPDPATGYPITPRHVDAVTSSHAHHDHSYFPLAPDARRITGTGEFTVKDIRIAGFDSWHDAQQGSLRGGNVMYLVEMDGLRLLHAGDLGALPDAEARAAIGSIDILLVPIGGVYTIGPEQALELSNLLHPSVVVPMHYKTDISTVMLGELMPFLNASRNCAIHRIRGAELTISKETLGSDRIVVLDYQGAIEEE